jgi:hypothetical protein
MKHNLLFSLLFFSLLFPRTSGIIIDRRIHFRGFLHAAAAAEFHNGTQSQPGSSDAPAAPACGGSASGCG